MTLGTKPRGPPVGDAMADRFPASLITSMARARFGKRRIKARAPPGAVIRRWMPDFERRSSAPPFISSKGGRNACFLQSLVNETKQLVLFARQHFLALPPGFFPLAAGGQNKS